MSHSYQTYQHKMTQLTKPTFWYGAIGQRSGKMQNWNKAQQLAHGSHYFGKTTQKMVQICKCFAQWKDWDEKFHPHGLHFWDPGSLQDVCWTVPKLPGFQKSRRTRERARTHVAPNMSSEKGGWHAFKVKSNKCGKQGYRARDCRTNIINNNNSENEKTQSWESSATTVEASGTLQNNVQRR